MPIRSIEKLDYTWFFSLADRILVSTESFWRFVSEQRVFVSSTDHDNWFGLPKPVNAAEWVMPKLEGHTIVKAECNHDTGDLFLDFSGNQYLQFLQTSGGYESWRLRINDIEHICMGGGRIDSYRA
jgi:hypothetical protein